MEKYTPLHGKLLVAILAACGFQGTASLLFAQPCVPTGERTAENTASNVAAPAFLSAWTAKYPNSTLPARMNALTGRTCNVCHNPTSLSDPGNCYRMDLMALLGQGLPIEQAIDQLDPLDSDGDGFANGQEATTARLEPNEVGYNLGLIGSIGTDPCAIDPNAAVTGVAETPPGPVVPAVSAWGMIATTLLLASAGTLVLRRRHTGIAVALLMFALSPVLVLCDGCTAQVRNWDGRIRQWGTMHEVLGEGQTRGRVSLAEVALRPGDIGVGALEGLSGEITIADGHPWIAKETCDSVESVDQRAALLAVAHVPKWEDHPLEAAIAASEFDSTIREAARTAGLGVDHPFPFIIEGRLTVAAHVVRGGCPHGGGNAGADKPERFRFETREKSGLLVGFYADNAQGSLTHHGSRTHVHVLIPGNKPQSGHVDSAEVAPGSVLRLPLSQSSVGL